MAFTFYERNLVNTTSQIFLSSGSGTASNLYDRKEQFKWASSGESGSGTTATISIVFGSSTSIGDIFLTNHNFKGFNIIYNSNTANQFTPGLSVTANTNSNTAYSIGTTSVNSIDINVWTTQTDSAEKYLGQLIISKGKQVELDTNPTANNYRPVQRHIGLFREMIDGGAINLRNSTKFMADVTLDLINTQTFVDLFTVWKNNRPFLFAEFPDTFTASWNGIAKDVMWAGDFTCRQFRQNKKSGGYRGNFTLRQIPD